MLQFQHFVTITMLLHYQPVLLFSLLTCCIYLSQYVLCIQLSGTSSPMHLVHPHCLLNLTYQIVPLMCHAFSHQEHAMSVI